MTLPDERYRAVVWAGRFLQSLSYSRETPRVPLKIRQEARSIQQDTIDWWATQPAAARDEAFNEADRIPLDQALDDLGKIIWQSKRIWAQGPTYDMNILEHAYKSYSKPLPWMFYVVRDSRTVFGLWPELPKPPTSHHALEDCRRQIDMLQLTLRHLNVKELS